MCSLAAAAERRARYFKKVAVCLDAARAQLAYVDSAEAALHALGVGQPQIAAGDFFADELAADRHHFVSALRALATALGDADLARLVGRFLRGVRTTPALERALRRCVETAPALEHTDRLFTALTQAPLARQLASLHLANR